MRRLETKNEGLEAWVELPDVWTSGHYNTYAKGYEAAREYSNPLRQLAGVLALIQDGIVKAEVPGLTWEGETPNLSNLDARALGFLRNAIAVPLEMTQVVPFAPSKISANGTKGGKE